MTTDRLLAPHAQGQLTAAITDLTGDYQLDPAHTRIGFVARHAMVTKVRGQFNDFEGSGVVDARPPVGGDGATSGAGVPRSSAARGGLPGRFRRRRPGIPPAGKAPLRPPSEDFLQPARLRLKHPEHDARVVQEEGFELRPGDLEHADAGSHGRRAGEGSRPVRSRRRGRSPCRSRCSAGWPWRLRGKRSPAAETAAMSITTFG